MTDFVSITREAQASLRAAEHACILQRSRAGRYRLVDVHGEVADWFPDEGGTLKMIEDELDLYDQISALPLRPRT